MVAPQRRRVRQEEVRDEHRLRAAQVRVRRHQRGAGRLGLIGAGRDERRDRLLQHRNPPPQVQPQVERDLLVARAAGVQTPAGVADPFDQLALDEAVHVFVGARHECRIAAAFLQDRLQARRRSRGRRRPTARRRRQAPRPTRCCRSRRLRRARGRSRTRCRSRTRRDRARCRTGRTRAS